MSKKYCTNWDLNSGLSACRANAPTTQLFIYHSPFNLKQLLLKQQGSKSS